VVIRVLLVDDDALVRTGLRLMLDGHTAPDGRTLAVVGEAADGVEVPDAVAAHHPDVVLMDLRMPRVPGTAATAALRRRPGAPAVVVLTTFDADEHVVRALRAGASGFLLKDSPPTRIVEAVCAAADGDAMLSPAVTRRVIDLVAADDGRARAARAKLAALTPREREVARAVARGGSNAVIAGELYMSVATVKAYVSRLLRDLDLDNRVQVALLVRDAAGA
jgi:DNA-binding NarL/FixJ family response regulator